MTNGTILSRMDGSHPKWARDLFNLWHSEQAHCFLVHGEAVEDYAMPGLNMRQYLARLIDPRPDKPVLLVFYNRSRGIQFGTAIDVQENGNQVPTRELERRARQRFEQAAPLAGVGTAAGGKLARLNAMMAGQQGQGEELDPASLPLPSEPSAIMPRLEQLLSQSAEKDTAGVWMGAQVILVIEAAHTLVPPADYAALSPEDRTMLVRFRSWGQDQAIGNRGHIIVITTPDIGSVHPSLRDATSGVRALEVPLPDQEKRQGFIERLDEAYAETQAEENEARAEEGLDPLPILPMLEEGMTATTFAALTAGLPLKGVEDIVLRARFEEQPVSRPLIIERKKDLIKTGYGDVIELLDPEEGLEAIAGMEAAKAWFRTNVVEPFKTGDRERMLYRSAVLFGPPGTGKTAFATGLAKDSGVGCARIDPSQWFGGIVGDTERNTRRALNLCKVLTPLVLFIDEIDQVLRRGEGTEGDSGVSRRMFKSVMEFASDPALQGKVFLVAASNRPDLCDDALIRVGRLGDVRIPVLAPEADEREQILQLYARKTFLADLPDAAAKRIVAATEGWTGAQIKHLAKKALEVFWAKRAGTHEGAFALAVTLLHPRATEEVKRQAAHALWYAEDDDLIDPRVIARRGDNAQMAKDAGVNERPVAGDDYSRPRGGRKRSLGE